MTIHIDKKATASDIRRALRIPGNIEKVARVALEKAIGKLPHLPVKKAASPGK